MNHYTQILEHIKELAEQDSFVNHINQGFFSEVDLDKFVIPTLLNIDVTGAGFTNGNTVTFNVEVACLAQRDVNKEVNTDKFYKNDNRVDNMNETLSVLNNIFSKMYADYEREGVSMTENPTLEPVYFGTAKLLDGWVMTTTIEVPNDTINLCQ